MVDRNQKMMTQLTAVESLLVFLDKNGGTKKAFFVGAGPFWLGAADLLMFRKS